MVEIEVTSREAIKPSSPTPHHLKTFDLCLLDQMTLMYYAPVVFFYPTDQFCNPSLPIERAPSTLKESLPEALARFYPLAGRLNRNNLRVDCNDAGILYVEARACGSLLEFIESPDIGLLDEFLPLHGLAPEPHEEAFLLGIQVSVFPCGGIVIGTSSSHKVIDGTTLNAFLRTWAAIAAGRPDQAMRAECTAAATLFPRSEVMPSNAQVWIGIPFVKPGKSSARRFLFDTKALSTLKELARSKNVPNPTQVEALTGFLWKHAMRASRAVGGIGSQSALAHSINLWRRLKPPLPEYAIGNINWKAFVVCDSPGLEIELPCLVELVRRSMASVNSDYVEKIRGDRAFLGISKWLEEVNEIYTKAMNDRYTFVSWCGMGFNEVDFGLGRPRWLSTGNVGDDAFKNVVILVETWSGDGIEVWIVLEEREMGLLENDGEFREFASPRTRRASL
ncbi:hypothetical protein ACJRO7_029562 [Eucalyptus globulus]|uniref:Uncharacterized protein n=1 Tax=Eucalyptus globulus TaxID=34317 RepID=A0ABD3JLD3_EUCGL